MNKTELEKLKGLPKEIEALEKELKKMEEFEYVGDVIKDYGTGYPKPKIIRGYSTDRYNGQRNLLEKKIQQKRKLIDKFELWIETVQDADMRRILRYIYKQGMSQSKAAKAMGWNWTRDAIAQRLKRFFEKI